MHNLKAKLRKWLVTGAVLLAAVGAFLALWFTQGPNAAHGPAEFRVTENRPVSVAGNEAGADKGRTRPATPLAQPDSKPANQDERPPAPERKPPIRDLKGKGLRNERKAIEDRAARIAAISARKIVQPEAIRPPEMTASGTGEPRCACVNRLSGPRVEGFIGENPGHRKMATRQVHGRTYEVRGEVLVPLAGVTVCDRDLHRAISDNNGDFAISAYCETGEDADPNNDSVWLAAHAAGYIPARANAFIFSSWEGYHGSEFTSIQLDAAEGVEFFFVRAVNETFHVRITNPPPDPTAITLWMGEPFKSGYGGALLDEDYYVSVHADAEGKATFYVPPGLNWGVGAFGPGWQRAYHDDSRQPRVENGEVRIDIKIEPCDTVEITGECLDLRTGLPLPNIRLTGSRPMNEAAFTDAQGRFTIHAATTGTWGGQNYLKFSHPFYVDFAVPVVVQDQSQFVDPENAIVEYSPRGRGAWWRASMRPLVRARGLVVRKDGSAVTGTFLELIGMGHTFLAVPRNVDVDAEGRFETDYFPWGRTTISVGGVRGASATIDESCWRGDEPFVLRVLAP
jgi:hypothetical protein